MKRTARRRLRLLPLGASLLVGCTIFAPSGPDPSRFFVLTPIAGEAAKAPFTPTVGIGPFTFPPYLDRPEMVIRVSANEVRRATFDYWAGTLAQQFQSALAQNLQSLLGGAPIRTYPWYSATAPDLVVEADVRQFESATDGQAHLAARWRIRKGVDPKVLAGGDFERARPLAGSSPEQAAAALSELLGDLGRELAERLRSLGNAAAKR